jgi:hypothetical protein
LSRASLTDRPRRPQYRLNPPSVLGAIVPAGIVREMDLRGIWALAKGVILAHVVPMRQFSRS